MEYAFYTTFSNEEIALWHLYLFSDGRLYPQASWKSLICDSTNQYIKGKILVALSTVLLDSAVFKPDKH